MDSVVQSIIEKFQQRSELGYKKYGKTLDRNDLTFFDWANHMQEELMDGILYLEKLKRTQAMLQTDISHCPASGSQS